jgi:hypothetical protein
MATQNLFEKYGIKEVADITFSRIEKKEETYESQRKIAASSILRGALELRDVYPIVDGAGEEDGFKAYVFTDATINRGTNYDCDDSQTLETKIKITYTESRDSLEGNDEIFEKGVVPYIKDNFVTIFKNAFSSEKGEEVSTGTDEDSAVSQGFTVELSQAKETETGVTYSSTKLADILANENVEVTVESDDIVIDKSTIDEIDTEEVEVDDKTVYNSVGTFLVNAKVTISNKEEEATGVYNNTTSTTPDPDYEIGTHEYSYAEQICMLFAKRQNIISKTGVRYIFENADDIFGEITFDDNFAAAPYSTEQIVVVGLVGKFDDGTYDIEEVNDVISQLKDSVDAKAYDVVYNDYAELVVEDEMGYYNPKFLGRDYVKRKGVGQITFFGENGYEKYVGTDNVDNAIDDAVMWSDGVHYSINDAIDALRQKKLILDASESNGTAGIDSIFGGYKVASEETPDAGKEDIVKDGYTSNTYKYGIDNAGTLADATDVKGEAVTSEYPLADVTDAVNDIGRSGAAFGKALRVDVANGGKSSNRAIYIKVDGSVDTSAGAYIYLLRNKNFKKLSLDKEGIFKFTDKKGNVLYYQDKIFKGVEYLALVILGDKGLIFVVNRHGTSNTNKIAWMVNDKGYVTNS